jgi:hypothetical protein
VVELESQQDEGERSVKLSARGKAGHYMGTEIDEKWWKRYRKDGFFARGRGICWYDEKAFYFLKLLAKEPIRIPLDQIIDLRIAKWHPGQWAGGNPVLKIIWKRDGLLLSSGFLLSKKREDIEKMIEKIKILRSASLAAENEPPKYGAVDGLVYQ